MPLYLFYYWNSMIQVTCSAPASKGQTQDYLIYVPRARHLATKSETLFDRPDLQLIHVFGLISFYFLCAGQINRYQNLILPCASRN